MDRRQFLSAAALTAVIGGSGLATLAFARQSDGDPVVAPALTGNRPAATGLTVQRLAEPGRTVIIDPSGAQLATCTDGARTVLFTGPQRTFAEPRFTAATITSTARVRLAPQPWAPGTERAPWFHDWFTGAVRSTAPDVLAIAMQYLDGAPAQTDATGVRFAGDARFGPDSKEGKLENSDFYDYLGVDWAFPDGVHRKHTRFRYGSLDCSGFVRMVYGYRSGYPLLGTNTAGPGLPRRAWAINALGPGTPIIPDRGVQATDYTALQAGDVLLFNLEPWNGNQVTHTGIYLGTDNAGHHRVMSSRKVANGPSFGDAGGTSVVDRQGTYSRALRAAKRL